MLQMFVPRAAEIDQDKDRRLAAVAKLLAECFSLHAAATYLLEHEPWDFSAVYYPSIDHFSHAFMAGGKCRRRRDGHRISISTFCRVREKSRPPAR